MKENMVLLIFMLLIFSAPYSFLSATKINLKNTTPYAITVAMKGEGLVFASELPRVAFLSPGESFLFDAGLGDIQEITAFMCGVVTQFVLDIKETSKLQNISLTTISDILILSIEEQDKKTKTITSVYLKGAVIKQTRLKCPCIYQSK